MRDFFPSFAVLGTSAETTEINIGNDEVYKNYATRGIASNRRVKTTFRSSVRFSIHAARASLSRRLVAWSFPVYTREALVGALTRLQFSEDRWNNDDYQQSEKNATKNVNRLHLATGSSEARVLRRGRRILCLPLPHLLPRFFFCSWYPFFVVLFWFSFLFSSCSSSFLVETLPVSVALGLVSLRRQTRRHRFYPLVELLQKCAYTSGRLFA